jgi:HAMP domain-containing protein
MDEIFALVGLLSTFIAATAGFATAWWTSRGHVRRLERLLTNLSSGDERTEVLEHELAGLREQLDRMREGQEFLTRLLAERPARPLPSANDQNRP